MSHASHLSQSQPSLLTPDQLREVKLQSNDQFHRIIVAKLAPYALKDAWFRNFSQCGTETGAALWCPCCGERQTLLARCSQRYCPRCVWRSTMKRREALNLWTVTTPDLLHLVTTQRNFEVIDRPKIASHAKNIWRLRRQRWFRDAVSGGCYSTEVTNKGEGWHLHSHWLVESRFVDIRRLSVEWGTLCGQEFGIVQFGQGNASYAAEVCKYVCKGSEIAAWEPSDILAFIQSIRGKRFFGAFGSMFQKRSEITRLLNSAEKPETECTHCGTTGASVYIPDISMRDSVIIEHFA